ncbi:MAG: hypothetical protein WKG07_29725 [Hymenobacter sp.]
MPEGQKLYTGSKVTINAPEKLQQRKRRCKPSWRAVMRPKPNASFLGLRPKLYLLAPGAWAKPRASGKLLADKLGETPGAAGQVKIAATARPDARTAFTTTAFSRARWGTRSRTQDKTAQVDYTGRQRPGATPFRKFTSRDRDTLRGRRHPGHAARKTLLKVGDPYNLGTCH